MDVVFAKTAKGTEEITSRSGALTPRMRRVLILVDGRRSIATLRELVSADDLTHTLGLLEESGFIELGGLAEPDGAIVPSDGPLPSITAFRELPAGRNPMDMEKAKHYMINTLKVFCGQYGPVSLMAAIHGADSHEALREHFAAWYHAIVETRQGRRRAEELRSDLLKVI